MQGRCPENSGAFRCIFKLLSLQLLWRTEEDYSGSFLWPFLYVFRRCRHGCISFLFFPKRGGSCCISCHTACKFSGIFLHWLPFLIFLRCVALHSVYIRMNGGSRSLEDHLFLPSPPPFALPVFAHNKNARLYQGSKSKSIFLFSAHDCYVRL